MIIKTDLDSERVKGLVQSFYNAIAVNCQKGPRDEKRIVETLNALAIAAATTLHACGEDFEAPYRFFCEALAQNLVVMDETGPLKTDLN